MISAQFKKPFAEQLEYFQQKLRLPVADWRDMPGRYNDAGFFATGAMKADLVNDLFADMATAIRDGKGLNWFRDNFDALVKKHGWADTNAKFNDAGYTDWRARIIYQTNMATSYAAGRYTQLTNPDLLKVAPYWMYRHNDAVAHPRKWHLAWNRVTKLSTDPWWREGGHMPPNGWGCRCYIIAMSKAEAERQGAKFGAAPGEGETYSDTDRKTGEVLRVPVGIDRGWDYAPGATPRNEALGAMARDKLAAWHPDLGAAVAQHFGERLHAVMDARYRTLFESLNRLATRNTAELVATLTPEHIVALQALGVPVDTAAVLARDTALSHMLRDNKVAPAPLDMISRLPSVLRKADLYVDYGEPRQAQPIALIYIVPDDAGGYVKFVVRPGFTAKTADAKTGQRANISANYLQTAGRIGAVNLIERRYVRVG